MTRQPSERAIDDGQTLPAYRRCCRSRAQAGPRQGLVRRQRTVSYIERFRFSQGIYTISTPNLSMYHGERVSRGIIHNRIGRNIQYFRKALDESLFSTPPFLFGIIDSISIRNNLPVVENWTGKRKQAINLAPLVRDEIII